MAVAVQPTPRRAGGKTGGAFPPTRRPLGSATFPCGPRMTNRLAIILFCLIVGAVALDLWMGWGAVLFLLREWEHLIEWLAFWR